MLKVNFYELNQIDDTKLDFAVIVANYHNKWVFSKHKKRETWEIPGGRREQNECIHNTAIRELYEETGAIEYNIQPVCIYSVMRDNNESFGQLFYAKIQKFDKLPSYEIAEIQFFEDIPKQLTYPLIQPNLFNRVKEQIK